ncbi:MAG: T9SS type A sorting domain-containing protein [Saprospiraceae bacterium]|nr:T9SS type A sorting domain-containing protein [Saprospiraceae bacterium]
MIKHIFIKKIIILMWQCAGMLISIPAFAQFKYDYNWVTGFYYVEGLKRQILDFGSDTLQVKDQFLPFAFSETNSSISDETGNLLLYFNGCDIANGRHEILENGSGFNAGIPGDFECPKNYGYPGPYQSALILPRPSQPLSQYVFYIRYDNLPTKIESSLLYAETDLTTSRGKVLYKDKHALTDSVVTLAGLTAVKHSNLEDWWIVMARRYTNRYARLLVTSDGLVEYPDISIGLDSILSGGQASFSPDGTKYMRYTPKGLMVMDFDRSEGLLSNFRFLSLVPQGVYFGGTFSPNGRFIYLSDYTKIYQVDTWEEELNLELIAEWDGYEFEGWRVLFGMMQNGPDCRIYVASLNCLNFVHIIMNPDEKGVACNVVQRALELKSSNCGFPHFPNFRLGTSEPYCDPDKVVVTGTNLLFEAEETLKIFPNPSSGDFTITSEDVMSSVDVYDIHSNKILHQITDTNKTSISLLQQHSGIYFVHIRYKNNKQHAVRKIVLIP